MNTGLDSGSLDDQKEERPLKPGEVCVFQGENYAGQPQVLASDNPDLLKYFPGMVINTPFGSLLFVVSEYVFLPNFLKIYISDTNIINATIINAALAL